MLKEGISMLPLSFCHIQLFHSHLISVLHSSTIKTERKYLNAAKSSLFKGIIVNVVITDICITSPGHWNTHDYFFNCNYRFLATGESYGSLAFQFRIHHSWISVIVRQTLIAICERLQKVAILEPNEETLKQTADGYYRRWHFPHCCGSIDGKHIRMICPGNSGSRYFNYRDFYSIVTLALVDHNYKFLVVDVGSYGTDIC